MACVSSVNLEQEGLVLVLAKVERDLVGHQHAVAVLVVLYKLLQHLCNAVRLVQEQPRL